MKKLSQILVLGIAISVGVIYGSIQVLALTHNIILPIIK